MRKGVRGVEPLFRMLNRRDSTLWRSLVSHEASADEISATGGHQLKPLSNASHCLRSGTASPCPQMKIGTTVKVIPIIHVEHRGVEPLTSTMRMSRATNCANAPYMTTGKLRCSLPRFTSAGLETAQSFDCVRKYITVERKRQGIFDGGGCFRYNPGSR